MLKYLSIILLSFPVAACTDTVQNSALDHPFTGCWQSEGGMSREVWTQDPSGWLFGYSANREVDGTVSFFEQMRIEPREGGHVFVVTGQSGDIVEFKREDTEAANEYRFVNAAHDYPQIITYTPGAGRLGAHISLIGGQERIDFPKRKCD